MYMRRGGKGARAAMKAIHAMIFVCVYIYVCVCMHMYVYVCARVCVHIHIRGVQAKVRALR